MCSKDSLCLLVCGFCVSGQGEVGRVTCKVTCMVAIVAGGVEQFLHKCTLFSFCRSFISGSEGRLGSERVLASQECLLLQVHL